ncbi:DUF4917 family protein [Anaerosinus sp.]
MSEIKLFKDIFPDYSRFENASLILGNGASIAFNNKFSYSSLYGYACSNKFIDEKQEEIFDQLETTDFEYVLSKLQQAKIINNILDIDKKKIAINYDNIKNALINSVKNSHAEYNEIGYFTFGNNEIFKFIHLFSNVINLNYDLILYWILNCNSENFQYARDYFCVKNDFNTLLEFSYEYAENKDDQVTKIFYPHGNLLFISDNGYERKIRLTKEDRLLEEISEKWEQGYTPLFVSEGESKQKIAAIKRSPYLNYVYESILNDLGETIVIYGWAMGKCDKHIIDKIFKNLKIRNVVISIYNRGENNNNEIITYYEQTIRNLNRNINIQFFDSKSAGCWNNSDI